MFEDDVQLRGEVKIVLWHADGTREYRCWRNLVMAVGKTWVAARMVASTPVLMNWMSVGTDPTAPVTTQTALVAEIAGSRTTLSAPGSSTGPVVTYTCTFGAGVGTGALVEAGIFNDPATGTMLARVTFPVVNKGASDTMSVTWTITAS